MGGNNPVKTDIVLLFLLNGNKTHIQNETCKKHRWIILLYVDQVKIIFDGKKGKDKNLPGSVVSKKTRYLRFIEGQVQIIYRGRNMGLLVITLDKVLDSHSWQQSRGLGNHFKIVSTLNEEKKTMVNDCQIIVIIILM